MRIGLGVFWLALMLPAAAAEPMFRGGGAGQSVFTVSGVETFGGVRWRFQTGSLVRSSPVLADGVVYVGSSDGHLYAVDADAGREVWRYEEGSPIVSAPAVSGRHVFFLARSGRIHALTRAGAPVWSRDLGPLAPWPWGFEGWDYLDSSPIVVDETVYVGGPDGGVYALDAATGDVRWRAATAGRIRAAPAVADGVVYVGGGDGRFYALDATTGRERWVHDTEGAQYDSGVFGFDRRSIQSAAAVADGRVFFGSRDASIYALDAETGERVWRRELDNYSWVVASPAVVDGRVLVGTSDALVFLALDAATGEDVWRVDLGTRVFASPAVSNGTVYFSDHAGFVRALDVADGGERWRYRIGPGSDSSPWLGEGRLFVGSYDGAVYALDAAAGPAPRRAVFWEDDFAKISRYADDVRLRDHLEASGFERVGNEELDAFLGLRDVPSVLVVSQGRLPVTALTGEESAPVRRYLEAGGKIVWLGLRPLLIKVVDGEFAGIDRAAARRLLGIRHDGVRGDRFAVHATEAGERWGLSGWRLGAGGVDPNAVSTVLLRDEEGMAASWVHTYGGPEGTGFVMLWPITEPLDDLAAIRRVAEYGVTVRP